MTSERALRIKLVLAITLDLLDLTVGALFGFGTLWDVVMTGAAFAMFGWKGLAQALEVVTPDQIDGFVPTLTVLALAEMRAEGRKKPASHPGDEPAPAPDETAPRVS